MTVTRKAESSKMKYDEVKVGEEVQPSLVPLIAAAVIFPLSVLFWIFNYSIEVITSSVQSGEEGDMVDDIETVTPTRWFMAIGISVLMTVYGFKRKSLNTSGAALALLVGFFLTLSSYCFMISLLAFFLSSSKATKFRQNQKKKFEEDFKEGGQRNWMQVLCNGGMATELAILYLLDVGYGERPISFSTDYRASWLGIGILGALACANGDTWASELGTVIKVISSQPRLITTWRQVPKGTNGGVTIGGFLVSILGGLFIGLVYYLMLIVTVDSAVLERSIPQWPIIYIGGIGGLLGSVIDSLLGATLQYSGLGSDGKIHEVPGPKVKPISGLCVFDNHSVNLLSTILTGIILPQITCGLMWS